MKTQLSFQPASAGQDGLSRKVRTLVLCDDGWFLRHPEQCAVDRLPRPGHPVVAGVNPFMVHDEHYFMALADHNAEVFLHSQSVPGIKPAGWTRPAGCGRVCVLTPGHTEEVWLHPMFQLLLGNALHWASATH
jgi:type 1 glutamine amidotransferase